MNKLGSISKYEAGAIKMVSEADIEKSKKDGDRFGLEWRKRKRNCMEIIDTICESADLNRKEFIVSSYQSLTLLI